MDFMRGERRDIGDVNWDCTIRTTHESDRYIMEIAIPLKDMGVEYKPGVKTGFNAYRRHRDTRSVPYGFLWFPGGFDAALICSGNHSSVEDLLLAMDIVRDQGSVSIVGNVRTDFPRAHFFARAIRPDPHGIETACNLHSFCLMSVLCP